MKALTLPSFFRPACLSLLSSVALATQATAAEGTVTVTITEKDKSQTIIETKPVTDQEALVQIAILLDTSSSMNGLIEQAKTQLWKIVNEFNDAKQGDKTPVVQVALYEYGNNGLSVGSNYIRQVLPFTRDLDKVSEQLFKLTTNGGDEYCGAVIREALDKLAWDKDGQVYKAIFIAGNEPFTQGPVNSQDACKAAIQKGVVVNTIHCGNQGDGENGGWRTGAALAEGRFLTIDQDKAIVHIEAPQDKEITQLSIELNKTYIMYGKDGHRGASNQVAQDSNASFYEKAGAAVQRALTKASSNYSNTGWDLVDANKKAGVKLDKIPEAELPIELKDLAPEKRQAYLDAKAAEREKIQTQINKLNEERQKYVAEKAKESGADDTLDKAMVKAVREQAAKKAITFK
ncbi:von Willebrand factor type A domain-containing protein [Prosthecobacter debontii]|uniref:von Willebrand factor type A domain-containing protein n=1 Tax=Prosthecobacter debontii TaxID=48467 RepID=A0A1T4Z369_9BACT|nr:vWA domain-containing protein [Prosthecobacter debontii]SKB08497.1 von Willebrand factor type A domain-containing protein [Prosthecobacter debontii]